MDSGQFENLRKYQGAKIRMTIFSLIGSIVLFQRGDRLQTF